MFHVLRGVPKIQRFPNFKFSQIRYKFQIFPKFKKVQIVVGRGGGVKKIVYLFHFLGHFCLGLSPNQFCLKLTHLVLVFLCIKGVVIGSSEGYQYWYQVAGGTMME